MKWNKDNVLAGLVFFVLGGAVVFFVMPEKIEYVKIKDEEKAKSEETQEEQIKEVVKVEYRDRVIKEKLRVVTRKITFPDGKIVEEQIYESESDQVDRILNQERDRYEVLLAKKEEEYQRKLTQKTLQVENKRKFTLHAGFQSDLTNFSFNDTFITGVSYNILGPLVITTTVNTNSEFQGMIGIQF